MRPALRTLTAALTASLIAAALPPVGADALGAPTRPNLLVGFDGRYVDVALLAGLGATVQETVPALGIAAVSVPDVASFRAALALRPQVAWVEANVPLRGDSNGWDSNGWDSNGWDSNGWDSNGWDSNGWDSNGWDANGWASNGWDSNGWDASPGDMTSWNSNGWDSNGWDASGFSNGWDSNGWDSNGWDASGWTGNGWDSNGWDGAHMTQVGSTAGLPGTDPLVKWQWALAAGNVSRAAVDGGSGVRICIADTGVDATHPDLAGRVVGGADFVNGDTDASDDAWHGTHVAGIAAGVTGNGLGIAGLSKASILSAKVLDAKGSGEEIWLAQGIRWCQDNGADVISMSLGTDVNMKAVHRAVIDAFAAGIVLVASVGNTGSSCDCIHYPAAYPQVMAVGAVLPTGKPAPFSSVSRGVDVSAPGYAIVSTVPGGYRQASGTSMSTPFVSGLAALLLSKGMTGEQAMRAIKETARDFGPTGKDPWYGQGVVDVNAALAK